MRLRLAGIAAALALLPATATAQAPRRRAALDASDGLVDPRKRTLPARHRFRLAAESAWIELPTAVDDEGNAQSFDWAPLMISAGYQLQFAKVLAARASLALGPNVANTRNAMPMVIAPRLHFGYQGKVFAAMATYAPMFNVPARYGVTGDGVTDLQQPLMTRMHSVGGELSLTSRVDRVAITVSLGMAGAKLQLQHYSVDERQWRMQLLLGLGVYFDGSIRRANKARAASRTASR